MAAGGGELPAPLVRVDAFFEQESGGELGKRDYIRIVASNDDDFQMEEQEVILEGNDYYNEAKGMLRSIQPQSESDVVLKVNPKEGATVRNLCTEFTIQLVGVAKKFVIKTNFGNYNRGLAGYKPPEGVDAFNVLVFGPRSSGKSAIVSTILTALQPAHESKILQAGLPHDERDVKRRFLSVSVSDHSNLWDSRGFFGTVRTKELADQLIDGNADDCLSPMHAIIFVMSQLDLIYLEEENVADMVEMFEYIRARQCVPLIMLTKVDETTKKQRTHPLVAHDNVEALKRDVSEVFELPLDQVLVAMNYLEETERRCDIDALAYDNLEVALKHCQAVIQGRIAADAKRAETMEAKEFEEELEQ